VPSVLKTADKASDLYIFARFFAVGSNQDADSFANDLGALELAKELIELYNALVKNVEALKDYEDLPFFYEKLTQEEMDEAARDMAKDIAKDMAKDIAKDIVKDAVKDTLIENAKRMLGSGITPEIISDCLQLDLDTVRSLVP
jgi:type I site-specific restriction-modification system R (restriction) subunit